MNQTQRRGKERVTLRDVGTEEEAPHAAENQLRSRRPRSRRSARLRLILPAAAPQTARPSGDGDGDGCGSATAEARVCEHAAAAVPAREPGAASCASGKPPPSCRGLFTRASLPWDLAAGRRVSHSHTSTPALLRTTLLILCSSLIKLPGNHACTGRRHRCPPSAELCCCRPAAGTWRGIARRLEVESRRGPT